MPTVWTSFQCKRVERDAINSQIRKTNNEYKFLIASKLFVVEATYRVWKQEQAEKERVTVEFQELILKLAALKGLLNTIEKVSGIMWR